MIKKLQGPSEGLSTLGRALSDLRAHTPALGRMFRAQAQPQITQPLQVFLLQLDDIVDENFPERAKPVGWRYLILDPDSVAAADVGLEGDVFHRLMHGRHAERLLNATRFAGDKFAKDPDDYDLRILEIPSLYVAALWLQGPKDIFVPFADAALENVDPTAQFAARVDESFTQRILKQADLKREDLKRGTPPDKKGQARN